MRAKRQRSPGAARSRRRRAPEGVGLHLPPRVERAARALAAHPGVTAVFWGWRHTAGSWQPQLALSAHVPRKDPLVAAERFIKPEWDGVPVDVLPVGQIQPHASLDSADHVEASEVGATRRSAVSAFAQGPDGDVLMLTSGHGTLPPGDSGYEQGPWSPSSTPWVQLVDNDGTFKHAELLDGAVSEHVDFALARLPGVSANEVLLGNVLATAPISLRSSPLAPGDKLFQLSPMKNRVLAGQFVQYRVGATPGTPQSTAEAEALYRDLLVARPIAGEPKFSDVGDSGSLVFDESRRAVGFVVAGAANGLVTYVLPFTDQLIARLGKRFPLFFSRNS